MFTCHSSMISYFIWLYHVIIFISPKPPESALPFVMLGCGVKYLATQIYNAHQNFEFELGFVIYIFWISVIDIFSLNNYF